MQWRKGSSYVHQRRPKTAEVKFRPEPKPQSKKDEELDNETTISGEIK